MKDSPIKEQVLSAFDKDNYPLSLKEILKSIEMDRVKLSGYLEAMADYDDLIIKKSGPSNLYFLKNPRKRKKRG